MHSKGSPVKVLVVEDSAVTRELLLHILCSDPAIQISGAVHDGEAALAAIARKKPDVVTMDVQMPGMNGYEATRAIMASQPVPIVVISNQIDSTDVSTTCQALGAGAVMALPKPYGPGHPQYDTRARELVSAVKLMAGVKVVRRTSFPSTAPARPRLAQNLQLPVRCQPVRAVGIGASTGGPGVLEKIFSKLPPAFPAPIFVVQHISSGFIKGMSEWLDRACALQVKLAVDGELAKPGYVYLAPDQLECLVGVDGCIQLHKAKGRAAFCPAVTPLFRSLAETYGPKAIGILLTGMGSDGVAGLQEMHAAGAFTLVQDEASSVVFGMPQEALKAGAAELALNPEQIAELLRNLR
jgi:two-component system, chemotaxis family, protein-glutamate methylesterase/glutaminase